VVLNDYALYKSTFTLLYFTLLINVITCMTSAYNKAGGNTRSYACDVLSNFQRDIL